MLCTPRSRVHLQNSSCPSVTVILHQNRLSCQLPVEDNSSHVQASLVAVGNHLTWPVNGHFPSWVAPFERDGLFWHHGDAGWWVMVKSLTGCGCLILVFLRRLGVHRCVSNQQLLLALLLAGSLGFAQFFRVELSFSTERRVFNRLCETLQLLGRN